MKKGLSRRIILWLGATASASVLACCASANATNLPDIVASPPPLSVFLVRHAEKQTGDDPALTEAGMTRAEALADLLVDTDIEQIHSSDYRRTRQTAAPLAARLGLDVTLYDPRDLPGLADRLIAQGGRHIVVGHSNTTPPLAALLGGEGGSPIVEATEYDRLYLVTRAPDGSTQTTLLRFGATRPVKD